MPNWVPDNKFSYPPASKVESEIECEKEWERRIPGGRHVSVAGGQRQEREF